jgi:hypothetical protein
MSLLWEVRHSLSWIFTGLGVQALGGWVCQARKSVLICHEALGTCGCQCLC